ncbi:cytochrome c oxidase subunit 1 [compost metagenome]
MPSATILPFLMSVGIFIAGLGFMFSRDTFGSDILGFLFNNYIVTALGLLITFGSMLVRSLYDDHGWHIEPEELEGG